MCGSGGGASQVFRHTRLEAWEGGGTRPAHLLLSRQGRQRVPAHLIARGTPGCFSLGGILPLPDQVPPLAQTLRCLVAGVDCWMMRPELASGS